MTDEANYRREVASLARELFMRWSRYGIPEDKHLEIGTEAMGAAENFLLARDGWMADRDERMKARP